MAATVSTEQFINSFSKESIPVIDVRSEKEFDHAHIPGAFNICLLNNEARAIVGTMYKKSGREVAVQKGFELAGPTFSTIIEKAKKVAPSKEVLVYCWRGGMRSNIVAWILSLAGFKITLLNKGYKAYRNWVSNVLQEERNMVVLGGKTGSGKTELLSELKNYNEQILDLEALAHHKGSAFGALGQPPQPSNEMFENLLAMQLLNSDKNKRLWMENESFQIGANLIPAKIFEQMRNACIVEIIRNVEERKQRILNEYGSFSKELLAERTMKLKKRLGGLRLKLALQHLEENNLNAWCTILLEYYDGLYQYGMDQRDKKKVFKVELNEGDLSENVKAILAMTDEINVVTSTEE